MGEAKTTHVIKFTHRDGKKLYPAEAWCGRKVQGVAFADAQHLALRNESGSNWGHSPCKQCIKAIIKALKLGTDLNFSNGVYIDGQSKATVKNVWVKDEAGDD